MKLTDTHCHLDFQKFNKDRQAVIERAEQAGLVRILIPGLTTTSSRAVVNLAESHPMLFAAIGMHPTETADFTPHMIDELHQLAANPKVVAIGEIGLDYYWDTAPHQIQRKVFKAQLELAAQLNLPVVIHMREKGDQIDGACATDLINVLKDWVKGFGAENARLKANPGVLHSFSGSLHTARQAIQMNFLIGVTGPITYKSAVAREEIIRQLPLESLLIETDAPFLTPVPHRGKRNEPAFVRLVAGKIAGLHSRNQEEVAAITTANAARLFSWGETI